MAKMMKNIGTALLGLMLMVVWATTSQANPYILVDVQNGRVLDHHEAFDRWYPASLTKMMTAYVTFRALEKGEITLESEVLISAAAARMPPSRSPYKAGSVLTLDNALKIMLVKSANDIAMAIGETVGGSVPQFVQRMNAEASRIGMIGTHFANTNGLPDPNHYSTARDMALLAVQIRREFPQYAHYFAIEAIDYGNGRKIEVNGNHLIGRFNGIDGMKTGFICSSGFNLAASATRNGRTMMAVVLGSDRIDQREDLAARLLNEGFSKTGTAQQTLANLQPYGTKLSQVTDVREEICNEEAWKIRMQYRDEKGQTVFNSPFILALNEHPHIIKVQLLREPETLKSGQVPLWKVPLPLERPENTAAVGQDG